MVFPESKVVVVVVLVELVMTTVVTDDAFLLAWMIPSLNDSWCSWYS